MSHHADSLNITVVGPDDPLPVHFKLDARSLDMDAYYSGSPDKPDLAFPPHDGNSSGGYSTPITPYTGFLDLNMVDRHLSPVEGYDHALPSPFLPGNLAPSFGGLSLSDGSFPTQNDLNSNFKDLQFSQPGYPQDQAVYSPARASLSVVIPAQSSSEHDMSFMKDIFQFDELDFTLPVPDVAPFQFETLPSEANLQRISRNPNAHSRNLSWAPSTTANLLSPSLCFTPSDFQSASLLEAPSRYPDDSANGGSTTVQRRHSHTGGRSTSRDERGRSDDKRSPQASASSSRRSSPYPSPRPSRSPDTLSPNQIWAESDNHLAVPQASPADGSASLPRRHSFSAAYAHSRTTSAGVQHPGMLPYHEDASASASASAAAAAAAAAASRKVASQAGIKASEARRIKEAKFACDWCHQTFTTNHNLKNHKNVHLGVKDHPCGRCNRLFTTQSVLARHLKTCKAAPS